MGIYGEFEDEEKLRSLVKEKGWLDAEKTGQQRENAHSLALFFHNAL